MNDNYNKNVLENNPKIFDLISTDNISFLCDIDNSIKINKYGQYKYFNIFRNDSDSIINFISNLDDNKIYMIIPLISINKRIDDPYIILSRQILITKNSSTTTIFNFIDDKIVKMKELYNIEELQYY